MTYSPCSGAHLDANMHLLAKTKLRKTRRWIPPESFENFDLSRPSLMIPRIACDLKPILLPPGVLPTDHAISIVPTDGIELEQLEAALKAPASEAWIRARARRLENNYFELSTTLIRNLPVQI